ncbi:hypothetical protein Afil01_31320 [Actinorhabdospora filicis]|uniref:DUF4192 domain-containing protein n=1 Tax=Actinorhabdospora filicis TaxID=1785913 RepID=A0A9W6SJS1_9ACTN|nr:DUF4192 family protein [Actinorhabdospora filicis]GLZ78325.1 hypothetical protein Afil01_31320 [Actinorhabdospora filicis]
MREPFLPPGVELTDLSSVLEAIPFLLGCRPRQCVAVGFGERRLLIVAQLDLDLTGIGPGEGPFPPFTKVGVTRTVLIGYGTSADVEGHLGRLAEMFEDAGLPVATLARVDGDRYWDLTGGDAGAGRVFDPEQSPIALAYIVSGARAAATPQEHREQYALKDTARLRAITAALVDLEVSTDAIEAGEPLRDMAERAEPLLAGLDVQEALVEPATAALLVSALRDSALRREAVRLISTSAGYARSPVWPDLFANTAGPWRAIPALLLAFAGWRLGRWGDALRALRVYMATIVGVPEAAALFLSYSLRSGLVPEQVLDFDDDGEG